MHYIIEGAGIFLWPLLLCSLVAVIIIVERLLALGEDRIVPTTIVSALIEGQRVEGDARSVAGRIVTFMRKQQADPAALKAYAELEVTRMERGVFLLDTIVAGAPLIGLLGTVFGLTQVFASVDSVTGIPADDQFVEGVAQALSTTMIGLVVAIVALVGVAFINRLIDNYAARLSVVVERLIEIESKA